VEKLARRMPDEQKDHSARCVHTPSHQALTEVSCYSVVKPGMTAHRPYKAAEAARCSTKCCLPSSLIGLQHLLAGGNQRLAWSVQQHL
jgi:hypothetical protein